MNLVTIKILFSVTLLCLFSTALAEEVSIPGYTPPNSNAAPVTSAVIPSQPPQQVNQPPQGSMQMPQPATNQKPTSASGSTSSKYHVSDFETLINPLKNDPTLMAYTKNMRTCTPGKFHVPNVLMISTLAGFVNAAKTNPADDMAVSEKDFNDQKNSMFVDFEIVGWSADNKCLVNMHNPSDPKSDLKCAYQKDKVDLVATYFTQMGTDFSKPSNDEEFGKVFTTECQ